MKIRVYGDNGGGYVFHFRERHNQSDGKPFSGEYRTTRVWAKQKDAWKLIAQSTQVPPASQAGQLYLPWFPISAVCECCLTS